MFPGFYKKSDESLKKLWDVGIISFDANVLLSLYRYSDSTREEFFNLLKKFETKIWLTNQVVLEFNRNRCEVISDQEKAYFEFQEQICQLEKNLSSKKQPPFLSIGLYKSLTSVFNKVKEEVHVRIKEYGDYLTIDPIYEELNKLFHEKIGKAFSEDEYKTITSEGKLRYEKKIPPGYEDEKTKGEDRKYGDLIIWKQILSKAKETKMPIIFITNETKKDWWWKLKNDKFLGPRQELVEEMLLTAGMDFHMYSTDRFLEFGNEYFNEKVNKKAIEEIKEFTKSDSENTGFTVGSIVKNIGFKRSPSFLTHNWPNQIFSYLNDEEIRHLNEELNEIELQLSMLPRDIKGTAFDIGLESTLNNQKSQLNSRKLMRKLKLSENQNRTRFPNTTETHND